MKHETKTIPMGHSLRAIGAEQFRQNLLADL